MSNARVQSISPSDPHALRKVIEALEISEGIRGKPDDRKPTIGEVKQMLGGNSSVGQSIGSGGGSSGGGSTPSRPSGLSKKELLGSIVISWEKPTYSGHGEAEIYRSPTTSLSDAVFLGSSSSIYFIDWTVAEGETYHYFLRNKQVFSLGGKTGSYADSLEATAPTSSRKSTIMAGALIDANASVIDLGVIDSDRSLLISATGYFTSNIDYDFTLEEVVPETGNAASLEIKVNGAIVEQVTPTKEQPCVIGAYGQVTYHHRINTSNLVEPLAGNLTVTLTAQRLFPANTDPFEIAYTVTLL